MGDPASSCQEWEKRTQQFHVYIAATHIKDLTQKQALLLHLARPNVQDAVAMLSETGDDNDVDKAFQS